jgi:phosphoribosyl-AMP cyclohydrolase
MTMSTNRAVLAALKFNEAGLIPAVVQSANSRRVLMVAWMNERAILETFATGETVFFSRSRNALWHKGTTSGNTQKVLKIEVDCDSDCLLVMVEERGPACHNGTESCFDTAELGDDAISEKHQDG